MKTLNLIFFCDDDFLENSIIYILELKKFIEKYKIVLNNLGIDFIVSNRNDQFDKFNFFITDKESNIGKQPEFSLDGTKNYNIEEELAKAESLPKISNAFYGYKIDSFSQSFLSQLHENIIPCSTLMNNDVFLNLIMILLLLRCAIKFKRNLLNI